MHKIIYSVRAIAPADLPIIRDLDGTERLATPDGLLNMGLRPLGNDLYSCAEQYRSDSDDLIELPDGRRERAWWAAHDDGPWTSEDEKLAYPRSPEEAAQRHGRGELLAHGQLRARYTQLDPVHRAKALRARVIRSETVNVHDTVSANLEEQQQAFLDNVGDVLADLTSDAARWTEARRLVNVPANDFHHVVVPMADIAADDDMVEEQDLIPHAWAGER